MDNSLVRRRLTQALGEATASGRALANFMLANISDLPFETGRSIAAKVGVSELTVGRFCRSIGYQGLKDLKEQLKNDISDSPWLLGDRLHELRRKSAADDALARSLELTLASVVRVYDHARTDAWDRAARRLAEAERVFVAGFQTERGLAIGFVHQLRYLRDGVHLLDVAGGNFAEVLLTDPAGCALVLVDARRYSRQSRLLAARARARGIPVTIITDPYCDWAEGDGSEVFAVPTALGLFWDSTSGLWVLMQLLLHSIFAHCGPSVEERLNDVAGLYESFVGYSRGLT